MGSNSSKQASDEPLVFYAPTQAKLSISQDLLQDLTGVRNNQPSNNNTVTSNKEEIKKDFKKQADLEFENMERIVDERVLQEVERIQKEQELLFNSVKDKRLTDSNYLLDYVKELNSKHLTNEPKQNKVIEEAKETLIACYRNHNKRTLDCWKEVEDFKKAVNNAQKELIKAQK
ncbi:hypothetical protein K502DRAFT_341190 [Neoconidiobolus thromboides FSU 785]|nr:hypothetical protein K502DRAFT_341190 [Neoconidiobolus thromboides FSU 785]